MKIVFSVAVGKNGKQSFVLLTSLGTYTLKVLNRIVPNTQNSYRNSIFLAIVPTQGNVSVFLNLAPIGETLHGIPSHAMRKKIHSEPLQTKNFPRCRHRKFARSFSTSYVCRDRWNPTVWAEVSGLPYLRMVSGMKKGLKFVARIILKQAENQY